MSDALAAKSLYAKAIMSKQPQKAPLSLGQLLATKVTIASSTMEHVFSMPYSEPFFVPILPISVQQAMQPSAIPQGGDARSVLMSFVEAFN
jgi:hypothetical protein